MYRDFSAKSKQNILRLISEVEDDKSSKFSDYVRDHWSDFDKWIGKLGIKPSINDVNSYHKKVISKNSDAKTKTDKIFSYADFLLTVLVCLRLCLTKTLMRTKRPIRY